MNSVTSSGRSFSKPIRDVTAIPPCFSVSISAPVNGSLTDEDMAPAGTSSPHMNVLRTSTVNLGMSSCGFARQLNMSAKQASMASLLIGMTFARTAEKQIPLLYCPPGNLQNHLSEISAQAHLVFG